MTPEEHREKLRQLAAERDRLIAAEPEAIAAALRAGVRQADIVRDLGRSREHVRRVARANGITAAD